jgi:hypothetical protein
MKTSRGSGAAPGGTGRKARSRREFLRFGLPLLTSLAAACAGRGRVWKIEKECGSASVSGVFMECAPGETCRKLIKRGDTLVDMGFKVRTEEGRLRSTTSVEVAGVSDKGIFLLVSSDMPSGAVLAQQFVGYGKHKMEDGSESKILNEVIIERGRRRGTAYITFTGQVPEMSLSCE